MLCDFWNSFSSVLCFYVFNILFMFVFFFSYILFFVLFCVLFLLLCIAVSFLFLYKFTDRCHQVENNCSKKIYHIINSIKLMLFQITLLWQMLSPYAAEPWQRPLIKEAGFVFKQVHVRFLVNTAKLSEMFLWTFLFSSVSIILPMARSQCSFIYHDSA
jgi:hypothetical protein